MARYIGLDAHGKSCTFAVLGPSGRKLRTDVVETSGSSLVEYLRSIPGQRRLCLEEGTQSSWLYKLLEPHVAEIVVTPIGQSRGQKSDAIDAFKLAEALRTGSIRRSVFKAPGELGRLRELVRVHSMLVGDVMRVQLRMKSMYRARSVDVSGRAVYAKATPHGLGRSASARPPPCRGPSSPAFDARSHRDGRCPWHMEPRWLPRVRRASWDQLVEWSDCACGWRQGAPGG